MVHNLANWPLLHFIIGSVSDVCSLAIMFACDKYFQLQYSSVFGSAALTRSTCIHEVSLNFMRVKVYTHLPVHNPMAFYITLLVHLSFWKCSMEPYST